MEQLQAKLAAERAAKEAMVTALPVGEPAPAPTPTTATGEVVTKAEYDSLKAKHDSLKGRFEAEGVRGLRSERDKALSVLSKTQADIDALKAQIEELKASKTAVGKRPAHLRHVTDEEIADLDPDALDRQARMMRGVVEESFESLRGEVRRETDSVKKVQSQRELKATWDEVEQAYPGARQFNEHDADFNSFLETVDQDDVDGRTYGELGSLALERGNPRGVKRVIAAYLASTGAEWPEPAADMAARQERLTQPAKAGGGNRVPTDGSKPTYRESDVQKHTTEYTKGLWRGREADWKKRKELFDEAMMEGRVVLGV
jgi:hypothetical protein